MNRIKKAKNQDKEKYLKYFVNGRLFRGYSIGDLPAKFGCISFNDKEGVDSWMKFKGLVLIDDEIYFPTWN